MNTVISLLLLYRFNYVHQETSYDIAKAMLERIDELPGLSVSDFASDLGTSITTVNRFCKELGFSSFKNLKIRLKATRKGRMGQIRERMSRITLELLLDDMERILKVSIDRSYILKQCEQIAELFYRSRKSYLSGAVYPMALSLEFLEDMFLMG
ncbi:MAG: MurR/RpiR family transcriptional regulator [Allobaculum sp.]